MTKTAIFSLGLAKLTKGTEVTVNTLLERPTYSDGVADTIKQIAASQNQDAKQLKYMYKFYLEFRQSFN